MTVEYCQQKYIQLAAGLRGIVADYERMRHRDTPRKEKRRLEIKISEAAERFVAVDAPFARLYLKALESGAESSITEAWVKHIQANLNVLTNPLWEQLQLGPTLPDLNTFPPGSWMLFSRFRLRKPYISSDDTECYVIDNPVKKEWVFRQPYIAASQWKGSLRSVMIRTLVDELRQGKGEERYWEFRLQQYRLFGSEKDGAAQYLNRALAVYRLSSRLEQEENPTEKEALLQAEIERTEQQFDNLLGENNYREGGVEGYQGHLHFYATIFDQVGVEMINPHQRDSNAGTNPIQFECVPPNARGEFALLYLPPWTLDEKSKVIIGAKDFQVCASAIHELFVHQGFGAKTSSGFGVAYDKLADAGAGRLHFKAMSPVDVLAPPPFKAFHVLKQLGAVIRRNFGGTAS